MRQDYVAAAGQRVEEHRRPPRRGLERSRGGLGITSETRPTSRSVLFQDCDVIHDFSAGGDCAALAVLVSDSGTMSDIRFENIRCEDVRNTLVNCWIGADMWGHDKTRGHVKGVTFKDIRVTGSTFPVSKLAGFDEAHLVEDVTFENLLIQGTLIGDAQAARLQVGAARAPGQVSAIRAFGRNERGGWGIAQRCPGA